MDEQLLIHIVRKSIPRFTKSPSLVLIRLVLTEIQRLKTSQFTKKCMAIQRPDGHKFLCKFSTFSNGCSLPGALILLTIGSICTKLGDFVKLQSWTKVVETHDNDHS